MPISFAREVSTTENRHDELSRTPTRKSDGARKAILVACSFRNAKIQDVELRIVIYSATVVIQMTKL